MSIASKSCLGNPLPLTFPATLIPLLSHFFLNHTSIFFTSHTAILFFTPFWLPSFVVCGWLLCVWASLTRPTVGGCGGLPKYSQNPQSGNRIGLTWTLPNHSLAFSCVKTRVSCRGKATRLKDGVTRLNSFVIQTRTGLRVYVPPYGTQYDYTLFKNHNYM